MAEQEKDAAFWTQAVKVALPETQWVLIGLLANSFFMMLGAFLLGRPAKIPNRALLTNFVWKKEGEASLGDIAVEGFALLLKQVPEAAEPLPKEIAEKLGAQLAPTHKEEELLTVEMSRAEVAALLMAWHTLGLLLMEKQDWTSEEYKRSQRNGYHRSVRDDTLWLRTYRMFCSRYRWCPRASGFTKDARPKNPRTRS